MSRRALSILGVLLAVQVGAAVLLHLGGGEGSGEVAEGTPLLAFTPGDVDRVLIQDGDGEQVELRKRGETWILPDLHDFPADGNTLERLLDKLAGLEKGWPVATTAAAHQRFKVSAGEFERKITLARGEETLAELYVGTSPGLRQVHVRRPDEQAVYAVNFSVFEAPAGLNDWIEKRVLQVQRDDLARIELPDFTLERTDSGWRLADLADGEAMDEDATENLVGQVTSLTVTAVLETPPESLDDPLLEYTLELKSGKRHHYRFFKDENGDYLVHASQREEYFRLPAFYVDSIRDSDRTRLVKHEPAQEEPEATPEETGEEESAAQEPA